MKKIVLLLAMVAVCVSARAALEDRYWNSQFVFAPTQTEAPGWGPDVPFEDGTGWGAGWYAEVFNLTDAGGLGWTPADLYSIYSTELWLSTGGPGISPVLGEYAGFGYLIDDGAFGSATDLDTVQLVLYNNADKNLATAYITSQAYTLPDAPEIAGPDDVKVTFDFTGQAWQVPEPSTALLLGTGGLVVWFGRRKINRDSGTKVTPKQMQKVNLLHR